LGQNTDATAANWHCFDFRTAPELFFKSDRKTWVSANAPIGTQANVAAKMTLTRQFEPSNPGAFDLVLLIIA